MNRNGTGPISSYVELLKSQQAALDLAWTRDELAGYLVQGWPELVDDEITADKKLVRTWDRNWSTLRSENGWNGKRIWTRRDRRCLAASPDKSCQRLHASEHDHWLDSGLPIRGFMQEKKLDPKWYRRRKLLVHFIRRRAAFNDLAQETIRFIGQRNALAAIPLIQESVRLHKKLLSENYNGQQMQETFLAWRDTLNQISDYATALESSQTKAKRPPVNNRMKAEMASNLETVKSWTARKWATHLNCGETTVKETETWKSLTLLRQQAKAEKRQDRHRRQ